MERHPQPDMEKYAGVLDRRLEALLVDGLLVVVVVGVLGYALGAVTVGGALGGFGGAILAMQVGAPFALLGYQTVMEGYYGQTLGKAVRNIVVVQSDGSQMTWGSAIIRNLLRIIDALPVFYILGIVVAYLRDDPQRLGDIAGDTVVVYTAD